MKSLLLTLTAVLLLSACSEGGSPTPVTTTPTPIPTPAPATPTSSSAGWSVTIQTTAVAGPAFCIFTPSVGAVFKGDYDLVWHGDSVSFTPPDPIDWDSFTATLTGSNFTATNPPVGSAGMCTHYLQASTLAGNFSADKSSFTAVENWYFTLDSGEVKTVTFSWSGTRR
jgi:hypothetical protein